MPVLKNARHERFAQELAKGKSADEAYQLAGFTENRGNAARLKANESVMKRIGELQNVGATRAEVTIESLISEADEIQRKATEAQQFAAATGALTAKAKLSGLWIDKAENTNRNYDASRLSDEELTAIVTRDGGEGIAASPLSPSKLN